MNYSRNIASYSICLDVKVPTTNGYIVSVPVPHIRDVSLLCHRFQSERITEMAKRSNVVDYLDIILSRPGLLKPNRDILASRRQRSRFRDRVSQTGTVPEKPGRLVSLARANARRLPAGGSGARRRCRPITGLHVSHVLRA